MIRHPVFVSLLFLTGCGFVAAAGVIVIAGWVEILAELVTEEETRDGKDTDGHRGSAAGANEEREAEKRSGGATALRTPRRGRAGAVGVPWAGFAVVWQAGAEG